MEIKLILNSQVQLQIKIIILRKYLNNIASILTLKSNIHTLFSF